MMSALPPEGRKLLVRTSAGVSVYNRVSSSRIRTALSAGKSGHAVVFVEDVFAQSLLREILRRYDKHLMASIAVLPFGDAKAVLAAKKVLEDSDVKTIAVRDADKGDNKSKRVFKLPGMLPPEKEVFANPKVQNKLSEFYSVDFRAILAGNPELDHHEYAKVCCETAQTSQEVLEADCIREFLDDVGPEWYRVLCEDIKSSFHQ